MNPVNNNPGITRWAWVMMIVAFFLVVGAIWWASAAGDRRLAKIDVDPAPASSLDPRPDAPLPRTGAGPAMTPTAGDPSSWVVPQASPLNLTRLKEDKPHVGMVKVCRVPGLGSKPQGAPLPDRGVRGMFPMGDVVSGLPRVAHPYRQVAELFPSFMFGGRMWSFTGGIATAEKVDLVSTGYRIEDNRRVFALMNTAGPGKVLFLQSGRNPDKFAIYR